MGDRDRSRSPDRGAPPQDDQDYPPQDDNGGVMLLPQEEIIKMVIPVPVVKMPMGSSYMLETLIMLPTNNVFVRSSVSSVLLLLKSFCRPNVVRTALVALAL
jgi:hypothetical protein